MFEIEFNKFLDEQRRSAKGNRLIRLQKDLTGEKKLIQVVLWPVLKSFEGLTMEHEIMSTSGVRIFIDVFFAPLRLAFESEGYVSHAENITRDRFTFERMRARTMAIYGYKFVPYSWDELDKSPEASRRSFYELLGRFSSKEGREIMDLSVYEREVLRYALRLNRPLRLADARYCLQLGPEACRNVLKKLIDKKLISPIGKGTQRHYEYVLEEKAMDYLL